MNLNIVYLFYVLGGNVLFWVSCLVGLVGMSLGVSNSFLITCGLTVLLSIVFITVGLIMLDDEYKG